MKDSDDSEDQLNLQSTYGALFFGVPSHGMNVEAMASMIGDLPARYNLNLLDQRLGFRLRMRQHETFCEAFAYKDSKIVQFFELRESPTVIKAGKSTRLFPPF
jgi:protein SERAC1